MKRSNFKTLMIAAQLCLLGTVSACAGLMEAPSNSAELTRHVNPVYMEKGYPFSEAVEVDGWVFLSGAIGTDPATGELVQGGIEAEARQVMDNIRASLSRLGLTMDRVVKCTVMIENMSEWPTFNTIYASYFDKGFPARAAFGADGLALGAKVEVDCLARR